MKRLIYILIISICLFPNLISGLECTNEDKTRLQKLANNITYVLEEYEENGQTYFKVTFTGLSKELRLFNENTLLSFYNFSDNDFGETIVKRIKFGKVYSFTIYGRNSCKFDVIRGITINMPSINNYYNDEVCNNASEYKLCQKWSKVDMSYDEFVSKVTEYKKQQSEINDDNPNIENKDESFNFFDIYNKYYWPTFIGMICLLILLIILWIRQNKKNKL